MQLRYGSKEQGSRSCSLLGAYEGDTLELPVNLGLHANGQGIACLLITLPLRVGSEPNPGDKVSIVTLGVLVDRAAVVSLLGVELLAATTTRRGTLVVGRGGCRHRSEVDDWEGLEGILRRRILESLLVPRPGGAFQVETVDADTFGGNRELLLDAAIFTSNDLFLDLCLGFDRVERPLLLGVLSGDLLHGSSEETLGIIEASEPEGDGALSTG